MQSFEGNTFGSLDAFRLTARAMPEPSRGQVRIRVRATALGFADGLLVQGRYQIKPPLPYVPGREIAGVVDAVGPEVSGLPLSARVATLQLGGGLAEYAIVAAEEVELLPPSSRLCIGGLDLGGLPDRALCPVRTRPSASR